MKCGTNIFSQKGTKCARIHHPCHTDRQTCWVHTHTCAPYLCYTNANQGSKWGTQIILQRFFFSRRTKMLAISNKKSQGPAFDSHLGHSENAMSAATKICFQLAQAF